MKFIIPDAIQLKYFVWSSSRSLEGRHILQSHQKMNTYLEFLEHHLKRLLDVISVLQWEKSFYNIIGHMHIMKMPIPGHLDLHICWNKPIAKHWDISDVLQTKRCRNYDFFLLSWNKCFLRLFKNLTILVLFWLQVNLMHFLLLTKVIRDRAILASFYA